MAGIATRYPSTRATNEGLEQMKRRRNDSGERPVAKCDANGIKNDVWERVAEGFVAKVDADTREYRRKY